MLSYYFQGLALGAAMILPLGPQNAFVMNQGIRRQYHLMIALLCAVSDLLLICAGIFGGSALLMQSPWLLALVTWGGVAFLLWYGFGALKTAMSSNLELASAEVMKQGRWKIIVTMLAVTWLNPHVYLDTFVALVTWGGVAFLLWYGFGALKTAMSSNLELASAEVMKQGRWKIIVTMLAVTWLNPHVYLDTFVVLGSLGGQLDVEPKRWFALGTVSASFLWFFGLAILAAWLAPRLRTAKAQRIINTLVGLVMWFIAFQLAKEGIHHVQELFN
ncbi:arginine exporter ArgO [Enterobacter asburiae]|uniref:Arginine exporter protein ArgO n=10 Tax=Gammaproteobacteria TaxID=1236 RepID=A0AAW7ZQR4_ENTAS|nr:arginine exporter ArgO [Enterobacter asburiae]KJW88709.1 arginine exporter protein [Enterobacter asburiae]KJX12319.1 arginine exporter protein [Enterobacter asburiae]MDO7922224.1 arginine exporter ArgO [Enterobacter asburiae]MDV0933517.1 arginine exporter ArgO [Enterobacter asburiae]MDV1001911.1 arginine exporter ArgO [Enterobacter asburiae]